MTDPSRLTTADVIESGAWALGAKVVASPFGLLVPVLLARLLTPSDVGAYFVIIGIVGLASTAGMLGVDKAITSLAGRAITVEPDAVRSIVWRGIAIAAAGSVIVAGLFQISPLREAGLALLGDQLSPATWWLVSALVVIATLRTVAVESLRALADIRGASIWAELVPNVALVGAFLGIFVLRDHTALTPVLGALLVVWLGATAGTALMLAGNLCSYPGGSVRPRYRTYLHIGLPWLGSTLLGYAIVQSGLLTVAAFRPESEAAIYGAALRLALWVATPLVIANSALPPFIVRLWTTNEKRRLQDQLRGAATLASLPTLAIVAVFAVAGNPIMATLFGEFYAQGAPILLALGLGYFASTLTGPGTLLLILTGHQRQVLAVSTVVAPVTILAIIILGAQGGALGVAVATAAGVTVLNLTMAVVARRKTGIATWAMLSVTHTLGVLKTLMNEIRNVTR